MSLIGRGGGAGGISSIPSDLRFSGATLSACQTARDNFFTANPTRLVNGVQILLQPTGADLVMQVRDSSTWRDITAVIKGDKGDKGDSGVPLVESVNGKQGSVAIDKYDIGLGNADNTSDVDKPVSSATQSALNNKAEAVHTHTIANIDGLTTDLFNINTALAGKQATLSSGANIKTINGVTLLGSGDIVISGGGGGGAVDSVNGETGAVILDAADVGAIAVSQRGAALGVASLGADGKIPTEQIGSISTAGGSVVANAAARLALASAVKGDVAVQTDTSESYVLSQTPASVDSNWVKLLFPASVVSVAGKVGSVELAKADVGLGNVDNTTDLLKPISTATQTALDAKVNKSTLSAKGSIVSASAAATPVDLPVGADAQVLMADASTASGLKWNNITKSSVGLGDADNTSDLNKPVSTATQTALNTKASVGNVVGSALGTASAGESALAARADHVHPLPATRTYSQANAYVAGDTVFMGSLLIQANGAIAANTAFSWGITGATWRPVLRPPLNWRGVFTANTAYVSDDVVVHSVNPHSPPVIIMFAFTSSAAGSLTNDCFSAIGAHVGKAFILESGAFSAGLIQSKYSRVGMSAGRRRSSTQSVANNTDTVMLFNATDEGSSSGTVTVTGNDAVYLDVGVTYNTSNGRFTNNTGKSMTYLVTYQIPYSAASGGNRMSFIRYLGDNANRFAVQEMPGSATVMSCLVGSAVINLPSGSFFEIVTWQNSGSSQTVGAGMAGMAAGYSLRCSVTRMRD